MDFSCTLGSMRYNGSQFLTAPNEAEVRPRLPLAGRILVVEDDELLRTILQIVLTQEGFTVQLCSNGQDAKNTLSADRDRNELPEMVILDLTMPVLDGWQVAAWMDADPLLRDVPVVVTSATEEHGAAASALHADAYLVKPYDTDEILGVVALFTAHNAIKIKPVVPNPPTTHTAAGESPAAE